MIWRSDLSVLLLVYFISDAAHTYTHSDDAVHSKVGYFLFSNSLVGRKNVMSLITFVNYEFLTGCL
jgi:hypothetical protein